MKWLVILFFSLSFFFSKGQDTIVKRSGDKILAKITEVNQHNIKFKRADNPDGPVYTLGKEEIKYTVYLNGVKDNFEDYVQPASTKENSPVDLTIQTSGKYYYYKELRIKEPDMHAIVKRLKDPKLNIMVKSVENKKFIQDVTFIASFPLFFSGLYVYETNRPVRQRRGRPMVSNSNRQQAQKTGIVLMLGALACDVVSISFMFDRKRHNHLVVNAYNKTISIK